VAGRRWRLVTWTRVPGLEVGGCLGWNMHDPVNSGVGGEDRAPGWHGAVAAQCYDGPPSVGGCVLSTKRA
jgi:hypothetical protein